VRALLLQLSSGMKYLEWAHSFAGSGGVGVASISKQQAYKNNLSEAANTVRSCAKLAKQQMVQRASQFKAAGMPPSAMAALDYAYTAVRLLAAKLEAVASMNLLFVKTQGFNTTLRNLTLNTSPAATAAVAAAAAADAAGTGGAICGGAGGGAACGPGSMAAPAARAPGARAAARAPIGGPSPGESGTQNSASSAVELVQVAAEGSSRANDRADLADGVQEYITLTDQWASVAEANEAYLQKTGQAAARAAAQEAKAEAKARTASSVASAPGAAGQATAAAGSAAAGSGAVSAATLAAAHRVGQLILAVGFEAGLWDLPSVLDIARQAADSIMNLVEVHGAPEAAAAQQQGPGGATGGSAAGPGAAAGGQQGGAGPGGSSLGSSGGSGAAGGDGGGGGPGSALTAAHLACADVGSSSSSLGGMGQHQLWVR
jgi:hypothetical protein